jgi:hypothetical protein
MNPLRRFRSKPALAAMAVACASLIVVVAAVAHSRGSRGHEPPAGNAGSALQNLQLIGHRYAECLRKHGHPQIADPTVASDGRISFGAQDEAVDAASRALSGSTCSRELRALKDAPPPPPTAAELHQAVLFSRCVRQHGVPDWPDPHPDGTFPLDQRLRNAGKGAIVPALEPCRRFAPNGRIRVSRPGQR